MTNTRIFQAIYKGPANTKAAHVLLIDHRNKKRVKITKLWDYEESDALNIAMRFLKQNFDIDIEYFGEFKLGYILATKNFETQIK